MSVCSLDFRLQRGALSPSCSLWDPLASSWCIFSEPVSNPRWAGRPEILLGLEDFLEALWTFLKLHCRLRYSIYPFFLLSLSFVWSQISLMVWQLTQLLRLSGLLQVFVLIHFLYPQYHFGMFLIGSVLTFYFSLIFDLVFSLRNLYPVIFFLIFEGIELHCLLASRIADKVLYLLLFLFL